MIFQTYLPQHPSLKPLIKSFWYIAQDEVETRGIDPKMIPDGHYHMVINLGSPHSYIDKKGKHISPKMSHINAKQTDYVRIIRSGKVEIMGIVFQPYGLFPLLKKPISEISGSVWNMEDLIGNHIHEIEEKLVYAPTSIERFIVLEDCLLRLMSHPIQMKREIQFAVEFIMNNKGIIAMNKILDLTNLSERTFERYFKVHMGVTPKQFTDIQRMQFVLSQMRSYPNKLINLAMIGGFYDQSHFNHTFMKMVGTTPLSYLQSKDLLSDLYNTETR